MKKRNNGTKIVFKLIIQETFGENQKNLAIFVIIDPEK